MVLEVLDLMFDAMVIPTVIANLAATGCSLLLVSRGPSRRLKLLTLTVGLMSLSQTVSFLYVKGIWYANYQDVSSVHQSLVTLLSLFAIYLLGREIRDRTLVDRKLCLTEYETMAVQDQPPLAEPVRRRPALPYAAVPVQEGRAEHKIQSDVQEACTQMTMDLIAALNAITAEQMRLRESELKIRPARTS